nr:MAG TPA: hypothetical protein [Bacteriophage sp.]
MSVGKACGAAYPLRLCKILREVLRRYAAKAPAACRPFALSPKYRRKERERPPAPFAVHQRITRVCNKNAAMKLV